MGFDRGWFDELRALSQVKIDLTRITGISRYVPHVGELLRDGHISDRFYRQTADLVDALNQNIIAGAALDVYTEEPTPMTNPLRQIDAEKLILTPHTIGTNPGSQSAGQRLAAESILALLEGKVPDTVVNPLAIPRWRERFWS